MPSFSSTCSALASALTLATLPSDDALQDSKLEHPDFKLSSGHIRRVINGTVCHGVDWDGIPGIDSIVREGGRRSGPLWREFRAWRAESDRADLRASGDTACALLLKYFGPYHEATAEALRSRRSLQRERAEVARKLDGEFSPILRQAAREYLSPQFAYSLQRPVAHTFIATSIPLPEAPLLPETPLPMTEVEPNSFASYVQAAMILQEHVTKRSPLPAVTGLEHAAKDILSHIEPIERSLEMLDIRLSISSLPPIPGEEQPADMDRLAYGSLICRHRAVIVGLLLADAGYAIRLVEGTVSRGGVPAGAHLFLYSPTEGILEPSADGPHFWQPTIAVKLREGVPEIRVEGDLTYTFKREISLIDRR